MDNDILDKHDGPDRLDFSNRLPDNGSVIGHPAGLFVLFFTEMWERFSYYGMRALFVLFLVSQLSEGGFGWERSDALVWYSWYTGLVYLTPILGGFIADKFWGFKRAVVVGALLMTMGHAVLAFETMPMFLLGLGLLIFGNGFFKPNISSIVGQLYPDGSELKDSAYTIFYMGINAGAFLGILICGYLGENVGWSYGFGCAGIFMFLGMLQFHFGQKIFGNIGSQAGEAEVEEAEDDTVKEKLVPWTSQDSTMIGVTFLSLLVAVYCWAFAGDDISYTLKFATLGIFISALTAFGTLRLRKYPVVERDRLAVFIVMAFFTIFFWMAFEQAGGTMTIFAADYTDRTLDSTFSINLFRYGNLALTLIPVGILTWVLFKLAGNIMSKYPLTILFTGLSFAMIWVLILWINYNNFTKENLEVDATWFGILNSFFIISFAPLFSSIWTKLSGSKLSPSGPTKFAIGLMLLGMGFAVLAYGSSDIPAGAKTASASMIWLVLAYYFHTMGELCISPVGLSYVSKLSPKRLVGLMFGIWFVSNFVANFLAGQTGSYIDKIADEYSLSGFFLIFVVTSFGAGLLLLILNPILKKGMHGVE